MAAFEGSGDYSFLDGLTSTGPSAGASSGWGASLSSAFLGQGGAKPSSGLFGSGGEFSFGKTAQTLGALMQGASGLFGRSSQADNFMRQAGLLSVQGLFAGTGIDLSDAIIDLETQRERTYNNLLWSRKWSTARTRLAKAGVEVEGAMGESTPLLILAEILKQREQIDAQIATNARIRKYNEVYLPGMEAQNQRGQLGYQASMARVNAKIAAAGAKAQRYQSWSQLFGSIGSAIQQSASAAAGG